MELVPSAGTQEPGEPVKFQIKAGWQSKNRGQLYHNIKGYHTQG